MAEGSRPTWIRVKRKHLLPETLDAYRLPWNYDPEYDDYIMIREYVDHEFQRELFAHTANVKARRGKLAFETLSSKTSTSRNTASTGAYMAPISGLGHDLDLEVDIAAENKPKTPALITRGVTEAVEGDKHLQSSFHVRHILKASIMTAHERLNVINAPSVILEYFDGPECVPDTHFRWLHVQMAECSLEHHQSYLSQLAEIDADEKTLMLALLRSFRTDSEEDGRSTTHTDPFRIRRASAKRGKVQDEPTKWVLFLQTFYLAKASVRYRDGVCTPFSNFRHRYRTNNVVHSQRKLHSIRKPFPTSDLNAVCFSAFMTSTGTLVTFSPESLESTFTTLLSLKKLDSLGGSLVPRTVRLHRPNGATFHISLDLCDTYFALKDAVMTFCSSNHSDDADDYGLFTAANEEIKADTWQQYRSTPWSRYLEVYVRPLFVKPQLVFEDLESGMMLACQDLNSSHEGGDFADLNNDPSTMVGERSNGEFIEGLQTESNTHSESTDDTMPTDRPRKSVRFEEPVAGSRDYNLNHTKLPSNRILRTSFEDPHDAIVNLDCSTEVENLLYRKSSKQGSKIHVDVDHESESEVPINDARSQGSETTLKLNTGQVTPFFLWPTGDSENANTKESSTQSQERMADLLSEIDLSLMQGRLGSEDNNAARERNSRLYSALEPPDDLLELNDIIDVGLNRYEQLKEEEISNGYMSWQHLLYEVIRRWDSIVDSFCIGDYEHVVLQKFNYARARFYKYISQICEHQSSHRPKTGSGKLFFTTSNNKFFYVVDYSQVVDFHLPCPVLPNIPIKGCSTCQHSGHPKAFFTDRQSAFKHLLEHHFKSRAIPLGQWDHYVATDETVGQTVVLIEARRLLLLILDHLREIVHLINEIQEGSTSSDSSTSIYRLPKSLVQAFTQFFGSVLYATDISLSGTKATTRGPGEHMNWEQIRFANMRADRIISSGLMVEFALNRAKNDLILMSHADGFPTDVSYAVVDSPYVLLSVLGSLMERNTSAEGLHLLSIYKDYTSRLENQIEQRPGRRLQIDTTRLMNEVEAVRQFADRQMSLVRDLADMLDPNSFKVTNKRRKSQHRAEARAFDRFYDCGSWENNEFGSLRNRLELLLGENFRAVEISRDDQGKALFVIMIMTVIFLPLSFVASLQGMNTSDIRNLNSSQWSFWAIALPLTAVTAVVIMAISCWRAQICEFVFDLIPSLDSSDRRPSVSHTSVKYTVDTHKAHTSLDRKESRETVSMKEKRSAPKWEV